MIALLASLALAGSPTLSIDLDADGKPEACRFDEKTNTVHIGAKTVDCMGEYCEFEAHDVSGKTPDKQVQVCGFGPRDDRYCFLYSMIGGELVPYKYRSEYGSPGFRTSGNGIVLAVVPYRHRLYERIEKYTVKGQALVEVKQPFYSAATPQKVLIDRTFPILLAPDSKSVVANTRPKSAIHVLGEHGSSDGWLMVRLSSGVTGWVHHKTLEKVSDQYLMTMGAG
ncbi:MAG: SH3 domain-containing protein [Myxococcota bacterium]